MNSARSVKVHLLDGSFRVVAVTPTTTFVQLRDAMGRKLGMDAASTAFFDIFPVVDGCAQAPRSKVADGDDAAHQASLVLMALQEMLHPEGGIGKAGKGGKASPVHHAQFLFKRWTFSFITEARLTLPAAVRLLYAEAQHNVIHHHPIDSTEFFIHLAALQMQVDFGTHKSSVHIPGFLLRQGLLSAYLPPELLQKTVGKGSSGKATKRTAADWEQTVLAQYALQPPRSRSDARMEYLRQARLTPFYGGKYFAPALVDTVEYGRIPTKVVLCVTHSRVHLIAKRTRIAKWHFKELTDWGHSLESNEWLLAVLHKDHADLLHRGTHVLVNGEHLMTVADARAHHEHVRATQGDSAGTGTPGQLATAAEAAPAPALSRRDALLEHYVFHTPQGQLLTLCLQTAIAEHVADQQLRMRMKKQLYSSPSAVHLLNTSFGAAALQKDFDQDDRDTINPLYDPDADDLDSDDQGGAGMGPAPARRRSSSLDSEFSNYSVSSSSGLDDFQDDPNAARNHHHHHHHHHRNHHQPPEAAGVGAPEAGDVAATATTTTTAPAATTPS